MLIGIIFSHVVPQALPNIKGRHHVTGGSKIKYEGGGLHSGAGLVHVRRDCRLQFAWCGWVLTGFADSNAPVLIQVHDAGR